MNTIWDASSRGQLMKRFEQLKADTRPRWGTMDAAHMLAHVVEPMRAAMGEMTVAPKPGPFRNPLVRWLIIYVAPWPKGAPTAPEFTVRAESDPGHGISEVRKTMERFLERGKKGPLSPHPAFGDLPVKHWGALMYRHLDHHLRQFGL